MILSGSEYSMEMRIRIVNKRIKIKHMKNILMKHLGIKYYAERKFVDPCDTCTVEQIDGYNCHAECQPEWKVIYLFDCHELLKFIKDVIGLDFNTYEFDGYVNIPKFVHRLRYNLIEIGVNGFEFIFFDGELEDDVKDYLQIIKRKKRKRNIKH